MTGGSEIVSIHNMKNMGTSITPIEREIEARIGEKTRLCYQCKKCTAGCPVSFAMDLMPHEIMNCLRWGMDERVLSSSTIWLCAACETCSVRCPNGIDIAGVMDALRSISLKRHYPPAEPLVAAFHRSFLSGIKTAGRTNEPLLIGMYKLLTRRLLDDIGLGVKMISKGKINPVPRLVKDRSSIRKIFKEAKIRGRT